MDMALFKKIIDEGAENGLYSIKLSLRGEPLLHPQIIDMVDYGCSEIADTFFRRKQFYENKNWKIQYLLCLNNNLRMIDEEMALTIIKGDS